MNKTKVLNQLKSILENNGNVMFAYLFGSATKNDLHYGSDIDIAIYFNDNPTLQEIGFLNLTMEEELNFKTDLVQLNNLDKTNPVLAYSIVSEGIIIINKDIQVLNEFKKSVILQYLDFKPMNDLLSKKFLDRLSLNKFAVIEK